MKRKTLVTKQKISVNTSDISVLDTERPNTNQCHLTKS